MGGGGGSSHHMVSTLPPHPRVTNQIVLKEGTAGHVDGCCLTVVPYTNVLRQKRGIPTYLPTYL